MSNLIKIEKKEILICLVGTGGIGANLAIYMCQIISKLPKSFNIQVVFIDGDTFEQKNQLRQPCSEHDLNLNKATVMAKKCNNRFNLNTIALPILISNPSQLTELFAKFPDHLPLLIGAVDNTDARLIMYDVFNQCKDIIYIDAANEDWYGEVITGVRLNDMPLSKTKVDYYPQMFEPEVDDIPVDRSVGSCELLTPNHPQYLCANLQAAVEVITTLTKLFLEGTVEGSFVKFDKKDNLLTEMISASIPKE